MSTLKELSQEVPQLRDEIEKLRGQLAALAMALIRAYQADVVRALAGDDSGLLIQGLVTRAVSVGSDDVPNIRALVGDAVNTVDLVGAALALLPPPLLSRLLCEVIERASKQTTSGHAFNAALESVYGLCGALDQFIDRRIGASRGSSRSGLIAGLAAAERRGDASVWEDDSRSGAPGSKHEATATRSTVGHDDDPYARVKR